MHRSGFRLSINETNFFVQLILDKSPRTRNGHPRSLSGTESTQAAITLCSVTTIYKYVVVVITKNIFQTCIVNLNKATTFLLLHQKPLYFYAKRQDDYLGQIKTRVRTS